MLSAELWACLCLNWDTDWVNHPHAREDRPALQPFSHQETPSVRVERFGAGFHYLHPSNPSWGRKRLLPPDMTDRLIFCLVPSLFLFSNTLLSLISFWGPHCPEGSTGITLPTQQSEVQEGAFRQHARTCSSSILQSTKVGWWWKTGGVSPIRASRPLQQEQ